MAVAYSVQTCRLLAEAFGKAEVVRPLRVDRYDPGTELTYEMTAVHPARQARVTVVVERFVGGGFAGQVYRVQVKDIAADDDGGIEGLQVGGTYAMKILVPPGRGSAAFRNAIYFLAFQSPFQLQVNPAAARAGALWQKLIRRAADERLGSERAVVDILATFVDPGIGSCGEISEWLEGRTWRFEVDEGLFARWRWSVGEPAEGIGSPEYRAKKEFMAEVVRLLHDMGAPELARQYEWWTCKSQPNCLKRRDSEAEPAAGLTAVDFRAGLALLPVLPMSPGDVALIVKGLAHGRVVQFDRGDLNKLTDFVDARAETFADMRPALAELKADEQEYRDSQVDVAHHHVRLVYDLRLWSSIRQASITGWRVRGQIDEATERSFRAGAIKAVAFTVLGLLGGLLGAAGLATLAAGAIGWTWPVAAAGLGLLVLGPLACRLLARIWGRADCRAHYGRMLTSPSYLLRAVRARIAEKLIGWHRAGRVNAEAALTICHRPWLFALHLPLSILPAGLHRMLTDAAFAMEKLRFVFVRPVRLYFNAEAREQWLRDMVAEGQANHMITDEDAGRILSRIKEPFIQKYLKSLAVHVCTLPVTQVVSVAVAIWYNLAHPNLTPAQRAEATAAILVAFQITPISPGSLARGLYVLYLVIRERNFKDYNIAVFLGFFKYIGYLAFPIQMAYRYPAMARFMAGHWATGAVHVVPVFGEKGALLEHFVFDLFYNYPLTVRRRMARRSRRRAGLPRRQWHVGLCIAAAVAALAGIDAAALALTGSVPTLRGVWFLAIWAPILAGAAAAVWARGASTAVRVILGAAAGLGTAIVYPLINASLAWLAGTGRTLEQVGLLASWSAFLFTLLGAVAALVAETHGRDVKTLSLESVEEQATPSAVPALRKPPADLVTKE